MQCDSKLKLGGDEDGDAGKFVVLPPALPRVLGQDTESPHP